VAAYKQVKWQAKEAAAQAGLKPYWGKPAVRNFRGGWRKRDGRSDGLLPRNPKGSKQRKLL